MCLKNILSVVMLASSFEAYAQVCIFSHHSENSGFAAVAFRNHEKYASKHGYQYQSYVGRVSGNRFFDPSASIPIFREGLYWQKVAAAQEQLAKPMCEWIMWIDSDAVFTNFSKRVEDIIEQFGSEKQGIVKKEKSLILTKDETGNPAIINNGVFLLRNGAWADRFLETIENMYPNYKYLNEEIAFRDTIFFPGGVLPEVAIIPQKIMNSFHRDRHQDPSESKWLPGDFIAHLQGTPADKRLQLLLELEKQVLDY